MPRISVTAGLAILGVATGLGATEPRWAVEAFTESLGGGPATGPALQARGSADVLCGDASGNLYLAGGQFIDIVTPDGVRHHLAGTGRPGFRDGPAHRAAFRMGIGSYYGLYDIACTAKGEVLITDSGNGRVRRLYHSGTRWLVETWAGGGSRKLEPGERAAAGSVTLPSTMAVAVLPDGEVLVGSGHGYYRIDRTGASIRFEDSWPETLAPGSGDRPYLNVIAADADRHGNAYFLSRSPNVVLRVGSDGAAEHFAGRVVSGPPKPHEIGDGKPLDVFLDAVTSIAVDPDGSVVYVCGGDEYDIRRIPTDPDGRTATLMQNGRWYEASVHPNRSRGGAVYLPDAEGALQPDGDLAILRVAPLLGRDAEGALYGRLNPWSGTTQYVEGRGLLSTKIFRIHPRAEKDRK